MDSFLKTGKLGQGEQSKSVKSQLPAKLVPWVEKYRPKTVTDVSHQEEVVSVLKNALTGSDLPNLLFYGPPGTGKTSTILAAARDLFGDLWRSRILELNASDERGIAVVRDKIKTFAQQTVSSSSNAKIPPFKIVILDEADSMTKDAQSALRRTMEKEGRSTRFCLVCNYISRIIEPITSRCAKFRFKPLSQEAIKQRIKMITAAEQIQLDEEEALDLLIKTSEGDMRRAITTLQSCARLNSNISRKDIFEVSGSVPDHWIEQLIDKVGKSGSFDKVTAFVETIMCEGFSLTQIICQIHDKIVDHSGLSDNQKSVILERLAMSEGRLIDGASEYLQMLDIVTVIMNQLSK